MQFVDIKNDIAFRKIFGNKNKTEILISFLNAVLKMEGNRKITWVEIDLILDAETQEHKLKDLDFNFIELPKFNKTEQELQTLVEKWVYFIKNAENLTVIPQNLDDEGLKSAYTEADQHTWKKEDLKAYEYARMRETDEKAEKMLVEQKAELRKQIEMAMKAIKKGFDNEMISDLTDLSSEQIQELRAELNQ